jgi:hypothetical protein
LVKIDTTRKKTIDISRLKNGIYIVRVQTEEGDIFFNKIIKE